MKIAYKKQNIWGFEYNIEGLSGFATLYTHTNDCDKSLTLYKYIDIEHDIQGGGFYDIRDAKRDFKNKIKELTK